jgi:hypothetical protein
MLTLKDAFEKAEALLKESGEVAERMGSELAQTEDPDEEPPVEVVVVPEPEGVQ